jgi:hypothetical protein
LEISNDAHRTIKRWKRAKNMNSVEFVDAWIKSVQLKKQQEFYNSLALPSKYVKPLSDVKIHKNYRKNRFC